MLDLAVHDVDYDLLALVLVGEVVHIADDVVDLLAEVQDLLADGLVVGLEGLDLGLEVRDLGVFCVGYLADVCAEVCSLFL